MSAFAAQRANQPPPIEDAQLQRTKRAASASAFGSMLEYYDLNIYGAASALVFSHVFFPESSAGSALLLSMATFGVAYVARPVGGLVLGHFGDRIGRKKVMLATLVMMGAATFAIGCLPSYATLGWLAPVMLVVCRILQGFSAGGEQSGGNAIILEHAPTSRRNFFSSWTMTGTTAGIVLASLAFLAVAKMPDEQLYSWGWRVPFWASAIVIIIAYMVRRRLEEPEAFQEVVQNDEVATLPIVDLVRTHPVAILRVIACSMTASVGTVVSVFVLAYAVDDNGFDRSTMLWVSITSNLLALLCLPAFAVLSDRIGRKPVWLAGAVGCAVFTAVYFQAVATQSTLWVYIAAFALTSVCYSAVISVGTSFYPEMFHTRIRYSGSAVGTQIGYAVAGFFPTIGYAIIGDGPNGWIPIVALLFVILAVGFFAVATAEETAGLELDELGQPARG
ncbi:MFS transporter [Aeromicrobium sp. IC_218]|uniref:MFS transporter n=1 Tax=Aeromicrobium sp. IC_218 TaxID=2545468 RepID=UPI00103F51E2|nr:MFS transporter [Aeromicrobium sp. IC_218]TCI96363.1 MFS transporter [Aeromicrobium sp. IC_218]